MFHEKHNVIYFNKLLMAKAIEGKVEHGLVE